MLYKKMDEKSEAEYVTPAKRAKLACTDDEDQKFYESVCSKGAHWIVKENDQLSNDVSFQSSPPKSPLPPCKYGANCYRKNILHFAQYAHPIKLKENELGKVEEMHSQEYDSYANADTDIESDDDIELKSDSDSQEVNECMVVKKRDDSLFMRGPSILRSYSLLTDAQRRDLMKRAFEMKQDLRKELAETQSILRNKNRELDLLRKKIEKGNLLFPGESEAQKGNALVYFPILPEREYKEGSAAQLHFRIAESQFYRLVDVKSSFRVLKVEYVLNPILARRFQFSRSKLLKNRGKERSFPVLGFHGTKECNIHHICMEGFKVPGDKGFEHATDSGNYGRGVYFSEYPSYSMEYIRGCKKLLLCQILPGKIYKCNKLIEGQPLKPGFDSHMSPDGKELVVFNPRSILPSYVVHYKESEGDFTYEINE